MINKGIMCRSTMGQDMPFVPKRTAGILGHCSEAWSGSIRKLVDRVRSKWKTVEASGRQVEDSGRSGRCAEASGRPGRGQEGPGEVGKAMGEGGRGGKTWESNGTLQLPSTTEVVIISFENSKAVAP